MNKTETLEMTNCDDKSDGKNRCENKVCCKDDSNVECKSDCKNAIKCTITDPNGMTDLKELLDIPIQGIKKFLQNTMNGTNKEQLKTKRKSRPRKVQYKESTKESTKESEGETESVFDSDESEYGSDSDDSSYSSHPDYRWTAFQTLIENHNLLCSSFLRLLDQYTDSNDESS